MSRHWLIIFCLILVGCNAAAPPSTLIAPVTNTSLPQAAGTHTLAPSSPPLLTSTTSPTTTSPPPTATATSTPTATPEPTLTEIGPFTLVAPLPATVAGRPIFLTHSDDGRLFLGTNEAVWWLNGITWEMYLAEYGEGRKLLGIDAAANVWVYDTELDQVIAISNREETAYPWDISARNLMPPHFLGILQSSHLWLDTLADIRYLENGVWTILPFADLGLAFDPDASSPSWQLTFAAASQTTWLTMCNWGGPGPVPGGGVRWFDGNTWHGIDAPPADGCALQTKEDERGRVWITTQSALYRYDPAHQTWEHFDYPEPPETIQDPNFSYRTGPPTQFELDSTGNGWMTFTICGGGSCGIPGFTYRFDETNQWQLILIEPIEYGLGLDGQGHVWLLWPQAMPLTTANPIEPLPFNITLTTTDMAGNWWVIGTSNGDTGLWVYPADS